MQKIKLIENHPMVKIMNESIAKKNLPLTTRLAIHADYQEYVLFDKEGAVFASQQAETIFCRIDLYKLYEDYSNADSKNRKKRIRKNHKN